MVEYAYSPMRGPSKPASSMDQVMEKLNKRVAAVAAKTDISVACSSTVEPRPVKSVVEGSSPSAPAIQWEKPTQGAMAVRSVCKRFTVAKIVTKGKPTYELWRCTPDSVWFMCIGRYDSFEIAKGHAI